MLYAAPEPILTPSSLTGYFPDWGMPVTCRDVKLENLLCAGDTVKLTDFGLAVDLSEEQPRVCVGTIDYYAPEVRVDALSYLHKRSEGQIQGVCRIHQE